MLAEFGCSQSGFWQRRERPRSIPAIPASTITPIAKIVVEELAVKLDTPTLTMTFEALKAADIAGRARAYGVQINAGMDQAEAAEATGLD